MIPHRLKAALWEALVAIHSDLRIAAFLRALSVVGMVAGMAVFFVGVNPLLIAVVQPVVPVEGATVFQLGILGLFVYVASLAYYNATTTDRVGDAATIRL